MDKKVLSLIGGIGVIYLLKLVFFILSNSNFEPGFFKIASDMMDIIPEYFSLLIIGASFYIAVMQFKDQQKQIDETNKRIDKEMAADIIFERLISRHHGLEIRVLNIGSGACFNLKVSLVLPNDAVGELYCFYYDDENIIINKSILLSKEEQTYRFKNLSFNNKDAYLRIKYSDKINKENIIEVPVSSL